MGDIQPIDNIHSIMIGDVKDGFSIRVGQSFPIPKGGKTIRIKVTRILKDENHFFERGCIRYLVYAKAERSDYEFVWQELINHSYKVTCSIPDFL